MVKNEILRLRSEGKNYEQIAKLLSISKSTVSYHVNPKVKEGYTTRQTERRRECKKRLVEHFGGKCQICGYSKSIRALQFHHIDPENKEFTINKRRWNLAVSMIEAHKCQLLCANCHFEIHDKE